MKKYEEEKAFILNLLKTADGEYPWLSFRFIVDELLNKFYGVKEPKFKPGGEYWEKLKEYRKFEGALKKRVKRFLEKLVKEGLAEKEVEYRLDCCPIGRCPLMETCGKIIYYRLKNSR